LATAKRTRTVSSSERRRRTWRVAAAHIKSGVEMLRDCTLDAYHDVRPRRPRKIDLSVTAIKTQLS
jgi:hypothetical protein